LIKPEYAKLKNIKLFLFDLEGVLNSQDNLNGVIDQLQSVCEELCRDKIRVGILTASDDMQLLDKIKSVSGCLVLASSLDKISYVEKLLIEYDQQFENVFYIGDEILDVPLLSRVGFSAAPGNARREVKRVVDYVCDASDGENILIEILDLYKNVTKNN